MYMTEATILTGLRANNDLHIGNYFGSLLPMIDMAVQKSDTYSINLFVPDLHSFTTPIDHTKLQSQIMHNVRLFVAAGLPLDNANVHVYRQSYIPAHSELTWILDCFTGFGEMSRMTQFKDKSKKQGSDRTSVGLFNYPVLMAADILLYHATYIPVGDDQTQHLEFARDIAARVNTQFNQELFTIPKPVAQQHAFFGKDQGLRIKDLVDPSKKMSKSDDSGKGVIFLGDAPDEAAGKIMSATTDDLATVQYDPENQPGIANLLQISALLSGQMLQQATKNYAGQTRYGDFKKQVAAQVHAFLSDFQSRLASVDDEAILAKLVSDETLMNERANKTLYALQQAVGLRA